MPKLQFTAAIWAAGLTLLASAPGWAADQSGFHTVADELAQRTKPAEPAEAAEGQAGGLSDRAVGVLMTYAQSILPEEAPGPDGEMAKVDKTDPNKFLIPIDDARRVIRAATRSAYAEACKLPELQQANYKALMQSEAAKKVWSREQLLMINALHMFSASYFAGTVQITTKEEDEPGAEGAAATGGVPEATAEGSTQIVAPKPPQCPPEQKQKVESAINAYVQAAQAQQPAAAAPPQSPSGAN